MTRLPPLSEGLIMIVLLVLREFRACICCSGKLGCGPDFQLVASIWGFPVGWGRIWTLACRSEVDQVQVGSWRGMRMGLFLMHLMPTPPPLDCSHPKAPSSPEEPWDPPWWCFPVQSYQRQRLEYLCHLYRKIHYTQVILRIDVNLLPIQIGLPPDQDRRWGLLSLASSSDRGYEDRLMISYFSWPSKNWGRE